MTKYIKEIKIGNIKVKNNVFLAPMAGITDLPFRRICSEYGGNGLGYTEMVSSKGLIYNDKKTHKIMDMFEGETPKAVQIFGSDVDTLKRTIQLLNKNKYVDLIDINMGCPAPKIVKNGDGAELLKDLNKVEQIIRECMSVATKPLTIKTRAGYYSNEITAIQVAKMCEKYGVSAITIHGRYKMQKFTGTSDKEVIRLVKENVSIPVIANGDIVDYSTAKEILEYTKADAIMIGRASLGNPWIFKEIINGEKVEVTPIEKLNCILEHIELATSYEPERVSIPKLRKHIAWYLKSMRNSSVVRNEINSCLEKHKVIQIIKDYFKDEYGCDIDE